MNSKCFITTPIYYVNDVPHIGHSYTTIAADAIARYNRLIGNTVFFLTGTDEHGAKVAQSAKREGKTPQQFCDDVVQEFVDTWKLLNISNDFFVRTTSSEHIESVQKFLTVLYDKGFIYKGKYSGLYCQGCERFYTTDDLVDKKCPYHLSEPQLITEENYFFKLSSFQNDLIHIIETNQFQICPNERKNEILGKLKKGVEDISISRGSVEWGINFPFDKTHTVYVWVDALINYISAIGYGRNNDMFSTWWPAQVHLMAKDILWFHAVIWPAMLLAAGLELPQRLFVHGFFTVDKQKMSKSLGNAIAPSELNKKYGADTIRYFLFAEFPFGTDGDFSIERFELRYTANLANDLGNLINRVLNMVNKYFAGIIPEPANSVSCELSLLTKDFPSKIDVAFKALNLQLVLNYIWELITAANRYVQDNAPWNLAKNNDPKLNYVLYNLMESIRLISLYLYPFMPETSLKINSQLGFDKNFSLPWSQSVIWGQLKPGTKIGNLYPIFPKLEEKK